MLTQAIADDLIRRANVARLKALDAPTRAQARAYHAEADRWLFRLKEAARVRCV
jgi:hypothetical protein